MSSIRRLMVLSERGIFSIYFAASGPSITSTIFLQAGSMSDSANVCGFLDLASNSATKKLAFCAFSDTRTAESIRSLCVVFCAFSLLKYSMSLLWYAGCLVSRCLANLLGTMAALANVSLQTRHTALGHVTSPHQVNPYWRYESL